MERNKWIEFWLFNISTYVCTYRLILTVLNINLIKVTMILSNHIYSSNENLFFPLVLKDSMAKFYLKIPVDSAYVCVVYVCTRLARYTMGIKTELRIEKQIAKYSSLQSAVLLAASTTALPLAATLSSDMNSTICTEWFRRT